MGEITPEAIEQMRTKMLEEPLRGLPIPTKKSNVGVSDIEVLAAAIEKAGQEIAAAIKAASESRGAWKN